MALLQCPECGKEISDQASCCPHCGYKTSKKPALRKGGAVLLCLLVLALGTALLIGQTTLLWSKEDRLLLQCVKIIQDDLLAPDSIQIYDAGVLDCTKETPGMFVVTDENENEVPINTMVYIYYGAATKGGGVSDGLYAFREVQGAPINVFPYSDADQRDPSDMSEQERDQALENALRSIVALDIVENVITYGTEYSDNSVEMVLKKAVS